MLLERTHKAWNDDVMENSNHWNVEDLRHHAGKFNGRVKKRMNSLEYRISVMELCLFVEFGNF